MIGIHHPLQTNSQHTAVTNVTQQSEQGATNSGLSPPSLHPNVSSASQTNTKALSVTTPPQQNNVCLLKTAIATVTNNNRNAEAYVLLDEGSQRSFVTQDLAKKPVLQPSDQETINISSFGATQPTNRTLDVATINLLTRSGEAIQLSVLVVPFIAAPLQNTIQFQCYQFTTSGTGLLIGDMTLIAE